MAIALFYAAGTAIGGPLASWLFGRLIDTGPRVDIFYGDLLAAAILLATVGGRRCSSASRPSGLAGGGGRAALAGRGGVSGSEHAHRVDVDRQLDAVRRRGRSGGTAWSRSWSGRGAGARSRRW